MACNERTTLTLQTTKGVEGQLKRLMGTGLYGTTIEEVAERVLARTLEKSKKDWLRFLSKGSDVLARVKMNPE